MANIHDAFPSKYLRATDLAGGTPLVTIDRVDFEPVGRTREMKGVVYFVGKNKGLVLNKTNALKIEEIAGSAETDEWAGTKVQLYQTEVEFQGDTVETIRCRAPKGIARPKPVAPPVVESDKDSDPDDEIPF